MKKTAAIITSISWLIISPVAISQIYDAGININRIDKDDNEIISQIFTDTCRVPVSKDYTYIIDNKPVTLINGISETESAPGSATKSTARCSGYEAIGDLNGDFKKDVAFILIRNTGGSGSFYYVAVIISAAKKYWGTNAIYIGDRIIVNSIGVKGGTIIVNYLDRRKDDPMSAEPTVHVKKQFQITGAKLLEVSIKE